MTYRCLIVDDERPALNLLKAYIGKLPHLELVAACEDGLAALSALQQNEIDILLLDIQMPDLTGLDLLRTLQHPPQVILTTAYRDYAVEGFALNVTDYLVKPFSLERFIQAINKATERMQLQRNPGAGPALLTEASAEEPADDHFFVKTNYKMEKIVLAELRYVESLREYAAMHTTSRRYVVSPTLQTIAAQLPTDRFMRVHRSFIVNLAHIDAVEGNQLQIGEKTIPIGATYRKEFFARLRML